MTSPSRMVDNRSWMRLRLAKMRASLLLWVLNKFSFILDQEVRYGMYTPTQSLIQLSAFLSRVTLK
jgi:hypothetical protein